jgi:hypothetical protein
MSKQVWSKDEENFNCDSLSELIRDYDLISGNEVWFGAAYSPSPIRFIDADSIIEYAQERAYDDFGDYAEDFLNGVTDEEKKNLNDFLREWLERNADVTFYSVTDQEKYKITNEDIEKAYAK